MAERYKMRCGLNDAEFRSFLDATKRLDRSRGNLLFCIIETATKGFTDFSVVNGSAPVIYSRSDHSRDRARSHSPRWNLVESIVSQDQCIAVREEAARRNRKYAFLIYLIARNATRDFSDFSLISGGNEK